MQTSDYPQQVERILDCLHDHRTALWSDDELATLKNALALYFLAEWMENYPDESDRANQLLHEVAWARDVREAA